MTEAVTRARQAQERESEDQLLGSQEGDQTRQAADDEQDEADPPAERPHPCRARGGGTRR